VYNGIIGDLQRDEFPHFYKSKEFKACIKPHLADPKVIILNHCRDFPYSDKDFQMFSVTQKDYGIFEALAADQFSWDLLDQHKEEHSSWYCEKPYFPNVGILTSPSIEKSVVNISEPFEKVCCMLFHTKRIKFIPYLTKFTIFDTMTAIGGRKSDPAPNLIQNSMIALLEYHFPYPINIVRRAPVVFGISCHPKKDEVIMVWKACPLDEFYKTHNKMPFGEKIDWVSPETSKKEHMFLMFEFGAIQLKKAFNGTQVIQMGGTIQQFSQ
jgi:hypothetical protein